MNLAKLFFELQYRLGKPPWDSGVTPPEVVRWVTNTRLRGRALDVGCGTGTNAIFLAQHGFTVVGVDFAAKAIATARARAQRAGLDISFHQADVTRLDFLHEPFDYILDIGCYHSVALARRADYAAHLARLTRPGSMFMLYAFSPRPTNQRGYWLTLRNVGATPAEIQQRFAHTFTLEHIEHGANDEARASAWYWFKRR